MRARAIGVVAVAAAIGVTGIGSAPAFAADGSSICDVQYNKTLGTSDTVIGLRVQAFDCAGEPLAFSGDVTPITYVEGDPQHSGLGASGPTSHVESADGAPAIALLDVAHLAPGFAAVSLTLTAAGDSVPYVPAVPFTANPYYLQLSNDPVVPGQPWSGETHLQGYNYEWLKLKQEQWGCDWIDITGGGNCVMRTRTSSDQTWQKGYKVTMTWPDPGNDPMGHPYDHCVLRPSIGAQFTSPDGLTHWASSMAIDVPANWGEYTLPLGSQAVFQSGVTPGATTFDVSYTCYSNAQGIDFESPFMTASNQLVPDLPPTEPTTVTADPGTGAIVATAGGSAALGAAPLQGYDMTVTAADGTVVDHAQVGAGMSAMRAKAFRAPTGSSHTFAKLKPGRYAVRVAAFNRIGASDIVSSRIVVVRAPAKLSAPRSVAAKARVRRLAVSWKIPASTGGGVARYVVVLRGSHLVQQASVAAGTRSFMSKKLAAHRTYRVTVTVVTKDGRTAVASKTGRTR